MTFEGAPVAVGELVLTPDGTAGNKGPGVLVDIRDGGYRTPTGKGHVGGKYQVRLTGFDGQVPPGSLMDHRGKTLFVDRLETIDLPAANAIRDFRLHSEK